MTQSPWRYGALARAIVAAEEFGANEVAGCLKTLRGTVEELETQDDIFKRLAMTGKLFTELQALIDAMNRESDRREVERRET